MVQQKNGMESQLQSVGMVKMVLRDWEKLNDNSILFTRWRNKKNKDVVRTFHSGKLLNFFDVKNKNGYVRFEKEVNTKAQVLKLAKDYMKKN